MLNDNVDGVTAITIKGYMGTVAVEYGTEEAAGF